MNLMRRRNSRGAQGSMIPPPNLEGWDIVAYIPPPKKIVGTSPECRPPPPPNY